MALFARSLTPVAPPAPEATRFEALMPGEAEKRARLRARPDFPWIARQAAIKLGTAYRGNVLLTRILNDRGRIILALLMLDMHFESPAAPGLTAGRLKAEAAALELCSMGRVTAILAAFRLLGLVAPVPDTDRRRRRLVVTERLLAVHKSRWEIILGTVKLVLPEGELGLRHLDDNTFLAAYIHALLEPLRGGWRPVFDIPELGIFADRDGGLMIAFALFGIGPSGLPLSASQLARTYRVSRSHVVDIVQKATEAGLVRRVEARELGGPGILPEPPLMEAMEAFIATALVRQASAVRQALAAIDAG